MYLAQIKPMLVKLLAWLERKWIGDLGKIVDCEEQGKIVLLDFCYFIRFFRLSTGLISFLYV